MSATSVGTDYCAALSGPATRAAGPGAGAAGPGQRRAGPGAGTAVPTGVTGRVGDGTSVLAGTPRPAFTVVRAGAAELAGYRLLRRRVFVTEQGLFGGASDADDVDDDPRTVVLVAVDRAGSVLGGVRLGPATPADIGWWQGGRLAVRAGARDGRGVGAALVRAACAVAEAAGALRFEASVQAGNEEFFARLGWSAVGPVVVAGRPHVRMRWPIGRIAALVAASKAPLGALLAGLAPGGSGFVGDDGAPVPGSDLVAACDAVVPSMVERDPEWAGWCGVLVNVNDLAAMGALPVGLLDAVGARDASAAARVLAGLRAAAQAYGVPVLGGHTQLGVPGALTVTALGRTAAPVPAGGGRVGDDVTVLADLGGTWRPGYGGRQWDSTSSRSGSELRAMVGALARRPAAAAKDVSMAGLVGTLGMLAEASGCGAEVDVAAVPRPAGASVGDWLTCFPGFGLVTADRPGEGWGAVAAGSGAAAGGKAVDGGAPNGGAAGGGAEAGPATVGRCGRLVADGGVVLRWPDGETTSAVTGAVTGLGPA